MENKSVWLDNPHIFMQSTIALLNRISFILILLLLPFQWVVIWQFGNLSLKPVHVIFLFVFFTGLIGNREQWSRFIRSDFFLFVYAYTLFLIWDLFSLFWVKDKYLLNGYSIVLKDFLYFTFFVLFTIIIIALVENIKSSHFIGYTATFGIFSYATYMVTIFYLQGINIFNEYYQAIISNDIEKLHKWFYPQLFEYSIINNNYDISFETPLRHAIIGGLIIYAIMLWLWNQSSRHILIKIISSVAILMCSTIILLSVSRANIIFFGVILTILLLSNIKLARKHFSLSDIKWVGIPLIIFLIMIIVPSTNQLLFSFWQIIKERFITLVNDPRWEMYKIALQEINQHIFWGKGVGSPLDSPYFGGGRVHNLFIASWLETGLIGLLLSITWYLVIFFLFIREAITAFSGNVKASRWQFFVFPILPLLRVLEVGGGSLSLVDMVALSLFFGIAIGKKHLNQNSKQNEIGL